MPYTDCLFDGVIISHVLEHLHNSLLFLNEVYRVLKVGGVVYIETPSHRTLFFPSLSFGIEEGGSINFFDDHTHIRPYTKISLYHLLKSCGFTNITTGVARNYGLSLSAFILWPVAIFCYLFFKKRRLLSALLLNMLGWSVFAKGVK